MEIHPDGFNVWLYCRCNDWPVDRDLYFLDVRGDSQMMEEVFAGVAVVTFACCVVYTFWMAAEESMGEEDEP